MKDVEFYKNEVLIAYKSTTKNNAHSFCVGMFYIIKINSLLTGNDQKVLHHIEYDLYDE